MGQHQSLNCSADSSVQDCQVVIQLIDRNAILPSKAYASDACFDLYVPEDVTIKAGTTHMIDIGLAIELPLGWEAQVRGRSSTAKKGLIVHPGTIDHLYRQSLQMLVHNISGVDQEVKAGERLAQMKISRVWSVNLVVGQVHPTERGGLGSTGR